MRDRGALPVRLAPLLDRDARPDLGGVEDLVDFAHGGTSFAELSRRRRRFANECAAAIRRRVLGDTGYRPL